MKRPLSGMKFTAVEFTGEDLSSVLAEAALFAVTQESKFFSLDLTHSFDDTYGHMVTIYSGKGVDE